MRGQKGKGFDLLNVWVLQISPESRITLAYKHKGLNKQWHFTKNWPEWNTGVSIDPP